MTRQRAFGTYFIVENVGEVEAAMQRAAMVKIPAALRRVTVAGAKPLRAAIKAEAPVGTRTRPSQNDAPGNLKRSVRYKVSRGSKGSMYTVGAFGKGSSHRHLVIYGHEKRGHGRSVLGHKFSVKSMGHSRISATGGSRTRANSFVARGAAKGRGIAVSALEASCKAAIMSVTH